MSAPIAPPLKPSIALCGKISATALWFDGPRQDARVSSPRLAMTRLMLTESAEPELDPSEADRLVSYGLDGFPPQVLRWYPNVEGSTFAGLCRPPGSPARPLYSVLTALAKMMAPFLRSCSTSTWSRAGKSMS